MEAAFELLTRPELTQVAAFRFAHAAARGPYQPWNRVSTLDMVAEALEGQGLDRTGPAFGIYHDLPFSDRDVDRWQADLGWPVAEGAQLPAFPGLRVRDVPDTPAIGLRYRGDLTSFPGALQFLVEWAAAKDIAFGGPLLERFHVSDALSGVEERDVYIAIDPLVF